MGGPTWPPTPEAAAADSIEEYGELARRVMGRAETDEEAELALLSHFLFAPPGRDLGLLPGSGTPLQAVQGHLVPWLSMLTGLDFRVAIASPAGTDGTDLYLPSAAPGPVEPEVDEAIYKAMSLLQLGLIHFGLLSQRRFLVELHGDWVLRSCWTLLCARYIVRRWTTDWPGTRAIFDAVVDSDKATELHVGHQPVPSEGLPDAFRPLYAGLTRGFDGGADSAGLAQEAVLAVDRIPSPAAAPLILIGQAQRLREDLRARRLGPPPLPLYLGLLRPSWMLEDLPAEMANANEWRKGNKPLRPLLAAIARKGRGGAVAAKLKRRLGAEGEQPQWEEEVRPLSASSSDGALYDEWDVVAGRYRANATRVIEVDAPSGPIEAYTRIVRARSSEIAVIRREFEALRVEERWHHAQPDGTDLDMSRLVSAMAEIQAGQTPRVDWYQRFHRRPRSTCILTLVDVSGSTQGAVIHAEREAMVLFGEALSTMGLPYAMAGFSSAGPQQCSWQNIKGWDSAPDASVQKRIANLRPGGGTRLGAFIRHATAVLGRRTEERRVLILVSDGRPEDGEAYRGRSGIEDCALAVRSAQKAGVHIFCLSLDEREGAQSYLQTIFGGGHFLICPKPEQLPARLPEVFADWVL